MGWSIKKPFGSKGPSLGGFVKNPLNIINPLLGGQLSAIGAGFGKLGPERPDSPTLPGAPVLTAPTLPQYPTLAAPTLPDYPELQTTQMPNAPTLNAAQLPQYPGFTPEEQALLQQRQQYLTQLQNTIGAYGNTPYDQATQQAANQELQNYQAALQGNIPQNQMIAQQKQKDWEALKQRAGQLGIQLRGNTPESAASQSTAGNQMILDFNKRYGALEQNYNLGQQQLLGNQNLQRLGLSQNAFNQQLVGSNQLQNQAAALQSPYEQQRLGQFDVGTAQATSNADIANQNAMNAYNQQLAQAQNVSDIANQNRLGRYNVGTTQALTNADIANQNRMGQFGVSTNQALSSTDIANQNALNAYNQANNQAMVNYGNAMAGYQSNMGLLQGGLGLLGTIGGALIGGPAGAGIGGSLGNMAGGMLGSQGGGGSYIQRPSISYQSPYNRLNLYNPGNSTGLYGGGY